MRKAAWGAVALACFAVATMRPIALLPALHSLLSLGALVGYVLIGLDPVTDPRRQQRFLLAGIGCGVASFLLVILTAGRTDAWMPLVFATADVLAVAVVALPLWPAAGKEGGLAIAAAALAAVGPFLPGRATLGPADWVSLLAFTLVVAFCALAAWHLRTGRAPVELRVPKSQRRPPRLVVGRDVVTFTDDEKAERLARLDARLAAGELEEHKYWDLRQELESR